MEIKKSKLLTRKEVIEIWSKQSEVFLNSFCCPNCRDILFYYGFRENEYYCKNCDITFERIPNEQI